MNLWVSSRTDRRKEGCIVSSLNFKSVVFVSLSLWVEPAYSFLKWGAVCGHLDVDPEEVPMENPRLEGWRRKPAALTQVLGVHMEAPT